RPHWFSSRSVGRVVPNTTMSKPSRTTAIQHRGMTHPVWRTVVFTGRLLEGRAWAKTRTRSRSGCGVVGFRGEWPTGVGLGEVGRAGATAGDRVELATLALETEGAGTGVGVQHAGHPVGEVLGAPDTAQRGGAVGVEAGLLAGGEEVLQGVGQHLDVGHGEV